MCSFFALRRVALHKRDKVGLHRGDAQRGCADVALTIYTQCRHMCIHVVEPRICMSLSHGSLSRCTEGDAQRGCTAGMHKGPGINSARPCTSHAQNKIDGISVL